MKNYWERRAQMNAQYYKYSKTPAARRLLAASFSFIAITILLMLSIIVWIDTIPERTQLFMKGCAGLCAIVSVVFYLILVYRSNSSYWKERNRRP